MSGTHDRGESAGAACRRARLLAAGLLLAVTMAFTKKPEETLLVWASDKAHLAPDFVAVIDFDRDSPDYGKVLRTVPLSGAGAIGNEPHHVGALARWPDDGARWPAQRAARAGSGASSSTSPIRASPTFIRSDNPPESSITDEFAPLDNGGFLVTFMGGANGAQPGRVVEYNADMRLVQTWPDTPPDGRLQSARHLDRRGAQPHGHQRLHLPAAHAPRARWRRGGPARQRQGLGSRAAHHHQDHPVGDPAHPAGTMEVQLIPRDQRLRAYTAGMTDDKLYLVDTQKGTATAGVRLRCLLDRRTRRRCRSCSG